MVYCWFPTKRQARFKKFNSDTFFRPSVTSAQCIFGTEKHPDSAILLIFNDDDYSQGYSQVIEDFRSLTKDDTFHHIDLIMVIEYLKMVMILDIIYTFSTYDIREI